MSAGAIDLAAFRARTEAQHSPAAALQLAITTVVAGEAEVEVDRVRELHARLELLRARVADQRLKGANNDAR